MKRLLPIGDSIETVKDAMNKSDEFAQLVYADIEDDEMYWSETTKEDFIESTQVKGFDIDPSGTHVVIYDFEKFVKTFNNYAPAWIERYFPNDLWESYNVGATSRKEFFYAINLACECIEDDYKEEAPKHMLSEEEFFDHAMGSGYYGDFYFDTEKEEVVKLTQEYSKDLDMTLIFKHPKEDNFDDSVRDIVNYYCGTPNQENLNTYYK